MKMASKQFLITTKKHISNKSDICLQNKKNAVIVTFVKDQNNYGQRLQNYALQEYLKQSFGLNVTTFDYRSFINSDTPLCEFNTFENDFMSFTPINDWNDILEYDKNVNYYILGGDQILNFRFHKNSTGDFYTLPCISNSKKIIFSASDGNYFSDYQIDAQPFLQQINDIQSIAFREKDTVHGSKLLHSTYVLDPIFLLSSAKYRQIYKKPNFIANDEPFIFKYVIDPRQSNSLEIVFDPNENKKIITCYGHSQTKCVDPREWLWLIDHADTVITSSFHGTAFGLLFNKRIVIFKRQPICSDIRFKQLIDMFKLQIDGNIIQKDQLNFKQVLDNERIRAYSFLKNAFYKMEHNTSPICENTNNNINNTEEHATTQENILNIKNVQPFHIIKNDFIPKNVFQLWFGSANNCFHNFSNTTFKAVNPDYNVHNIVIDDPFKSNDIDVQNCLDRCLDPKSYYAQFCSTAHWKKLTSGGYGTEDIELCKKIGFSDVFRFYLMNKYGGIYLDSDTFPVRKFDDNLLKQSFTVSIRKGNYLFRDSFFTGAKIGFFDNLIKEMNYQYDSQKSIKYYERILFNYVDPLSFYKFQFDPIFTHFKLKECFLNNTLKFSTPVYSNDMLINSMNRSENYYIDHFFVKTWNPNEDIRLKVK